MPDSFGVTEDQELAAHTSLYLSKKKGISLKDLRNYYLACNIFRILDWNIHDKLKDWVELKYSFTLSPLQSLPWMLPKPKSVPTD